MMTVVQSEVADSYLILPYRDGHARGWARIFVQSGQRPQKAGELPTWWCYVSVVSDWGNFGHLWSHCGSPAVEFLAGLEYAYAMGKFFGDRLKLWDSASYINQLRATLIERRRGGDLKKSLARDAWDSLADHAEDHSFSSAETLMNALLEDPALEKALGFETITKTRGMRPNPQATEFWRDAWPHLIEAIRARHAALEGATS